MANTNSLSIFSEGANGKILDSAIKLFKKPEAILALSSNDELGKVVAVAKVDKSLVQNGFNASTWINKVCEVIGGKDVSSFKLKILMTLLTGLKKRR
uniref:DHHA1 domain-containing protein n=1 Tax=Acrobeloides nanus TaxID=290746 RepID=A0A914DUN6_9BILA